jgi:hypothetical protein
MSYVVGILGFIAFILVSIAAYYIYMRVKTPISPTSWPPVTYMQQVGTICPDTWDIGTGAITGKVRCTNKYYKPPTTGQPLNTNCILKDSLTSSYYFDFPSWTTKFSHWPMDAENQKKSDYTERKNWTQLCEKTEGFSWQGF